MIKNIVKRDGSIVPFDNSKITLVVKKAFIETLGNDSSDKGELIGECIAEEVEFNWEDLITVEQIQDIVIYELYIVDSRVAHNYQNYRERKMKERDLEHGITN